MSDIGVIGSKQAFFQDHAANRAQHLQNVSAHLTSISSTLAERGKQNAAQNVANVAARVSTRATNIERTAQNRAPDAMPPVGGGGQGDGNGIADFTGKGTLLDLTA